MSGTAGTGAGRPSRPVGAAARGASRPRGPHHVAVVGAGMAAARFARQLLALAPDGSARVTLYGAEPYAPYNRTLLTGLLRGRYASGTIALPTGGAAVRTGTEVVAIDPGARTLRTAGGETAAYDTLVLATGAAPVVPDLPGLRTAAGALRDGVHPLRTLGDRARIAAAVRSGGTAVVVGGGVLGVDAAQALAGAGAGVHLVHDREHLLDRHLDAGAAGIVRRTLASLGVRVHHEPGVLTALGANGRIVGFRLSDGTRIDARTTVLACGARPRTDLARAAGLAVATGVVVDDTLATSAPRVYAIGDCAEHRNAVHGRAEAAWEQADALAAALAAEFSGTPAGTRPPAPPVLLRLGGGPVDVAAFGDSTAAGGDTEVVTLADATRGTYRKLVLRGGVPVGAILVGDLTTVGDVADAVARGEPVAGDALGLLVGEGRP
ncbi:FAD-dependent pyridine nucleotide-disulfide oxidoreductase [Streptomyces mobaraensis NBRC 13819 = DSM 40847]|uniref:FAD-dependent pyridine nucleotide-disulfide oxidoreductase n=1 Tax=Streptomyces mobaraensis (strain ATCC 29032 / DSM 40847 / JCM 4168 / NBRC 13819 / NCIMB 11159 / IPCR 16-22) TaxID=1223523 RepID=M3B585_STRM1|nr:FAD-dependent oxidoreductase [Streptomyces mobaraensis]EMF01168.1 FAD-dependent pyridine nucleotide-disulfide oxidoreductase [Streptomyces mobaraensis NBRC 13819 = DSM 40847]